MTQTCYNFLINKSKDGKIHHDSLLQFWRGRNRISLFIGTFSLHALFKTGQVQVPEGTGHSFAYIIFFYKFFSFVWKIQFFFLNNAKQDVAHTEPKSWQSLFRWTHPANPPRKEFPPFPGRGPASLMSIEFFPLPRDKLLR